MQAVLPLRYDQALLRRCLHFGGTGRAGDGLADRTHRDAVQQADDRHLTLVHFQRVAVVLHHWQEIALLPVELAVFCRYGNDAGRNDGPLRPAEPFVRCEEAEWAVLWPAIAGRANVVMDRRGIARAAEWAPRAKAGQSIPLSGDSRIARNASTFVVHGAPPGTMGAASDYILE